MTFVSYYHVLWYFQGAGAFEYDLPAAPSAGDAPAAPRRAGVQRPARVRGVAPRAQRRERRRSTRRRLGCDGALGLREDHAAQRVGRTHALRPGHRQAQPRETQQAVEATHLLRVAAGRLLPRAHAAPNSRGQSYTKSVQPHWVIRVRLQFSDRKVLKKVQKVIGKNY